MKRNKIIYIHQRPYPYIEGTFYKDDSDYYYYFGQGALYINFAPQDMKHNFEFEIWRGEVGLKKIKQKVVQNVKCKIFPAKYLWKQGTISFSLIKELLNERRNNNILIHYTATPHNYEFYLITFFFGKKVPIFVTHQGGPNPLWKFKNNNQLYSYISFVIEKLLVNRVSKYFSGSKVEIEYFHRIVKDQKKIQKFPHWGVDLNNFRPFDKNKMRYELNLDQLKKYILIAGRLNKYRGIREAIYVRDKLRELFDVEIISIGATKGDFDYEYAKEKGVILIPPVPYEMVPKYINAADCYLYLTKGKENVDFAGTGIAPLEAMACNVPVVSNTLHHYPELKLYDYGFYIPNEIEVINVISKLFREELKPRESRTIIEENFKWEKITEKIFKIYRHSITEFYS